MSKYRVSAIMIVSLLFFVSPIASFADLETEIRECKNISDSLKRLNCFDSVIVDAVPAVNESEYEPMKLVDFMLDKETLLGRNIQLDGRFTSFASNLMLTSGQLGADPIFIDQSNVSRNQRKRIIEKCDGLGCRATVKGEVGTTFFQTGIIAHQIDVE